MTFESKFRNFVGRIEKLSREEVIMISRTLLQELNKEKVIIDKGQYIENYELEPDEDWEFVNKHSERSNIRRYKWGKILGETLTKRILKLRNNELTSKETTQAISKSKEVQEFLNKYPRERSNMLKNIKINVCARYGENKTSEEMKNENNK